jgi:hypothetical protein
MAAVVAASVVLDNDVAAVASIVAFDYSVVGIVDTYMVVVVANAAVVNSDVATAFIIAFTHAVTAAFIAVVGIVDTSITVVAATAAVFDRDITVAAAFIIAFEYVVGCCCCSCGR